MRRGRSQKMRKLGHEKLSGGGICAPDACAIARYSGAAARQPKQPKAAAKSRAQRAGRKYPNLIDNVREVSTKQNK
jgi:hypothetical protein